MTSHRPSRTKMASRHGALTGTASERERQALRRLSYANVSELRTLLSKPSVETSKWARAGQLNEVVLRRGSLEDLRALCAMGAKFAGAHWNQSQSIEEWKPEEVSQWLDLLFERGWEGQGGKPEPLLSVAEFHPGLVDKWSKHAPKVWHNRRNWLGGKLTLTHNLTADRVRAWFRIGGTHAGATKLNLTDWFAQSKENQRYMEVLSALKDCIKEDKQRRRTRGEPPFREWPWAMTRASAAVAGKIEVMEWLSTDLPPPNQAEVIQWIANTAQPLALMEAASKMGWRVPHPKSDGAPLLINSIISQHGRVKGDNCMTSMGVAILMHLLDRNYSVNLTTDALSIVHQDNFPPAVAASLQAAQLWGTQPSFVPAPTPSRRPRL